MKTKYNIYIFGNDNTNIYPTNNSKKKILKHIYINGITNTYTHACISFGK